MRTRRARCRRGTSAHWQPGRAWAGSRVDGVGGGGAGVVVSRARRRAVADVLRLGAERRLTVVPRGSGSKLDWGTPKHGADLILDPGRLAGMWDHDVAGRTAEVGT